LWSEVKARVCGHNTVTDNSATFSLGWGVDCVITLKRNKHFSPLCFYTATQSKHQ